MHYTRSGLYRVEFVGNTGGGGLRWIEARSLGKSESLCEAYHLADNLTDYWRIIRQGTRKKDDRIVAFGPGFAPHLEYTAEGDEQRAA